MRLDHPRRRHGPDKHDTCHDLDRTVDLISPVHVGSSVHVGRNDVDRAPRFIDTGAGEHPAVVSRVSHATGTRDAQGAS
jgi:hypothetical protein